MPEDPLKQALINKAAEQPIKTPGITHGSVTPDERKQAIEALHRVLGTQTEPPSIPSMLKKLFYKQPTSFWTESPVKEPLVVYKDSPRSGGEVFKDDPNMMLAVKEAGRLYPNVMNKIAAIRIGVPQSQYDIDQGGIMGDVRHNIMDAPMVYLREPKTRGNDTYRSAMHVLRHELSHVAGLPDDSEQRGNYDNVESAYDVGWLSDTLNSDINLDDKKLYEQLMPRLKK